MDFTSIGSSEILMIILVAVLVVGPNRIVEISRTMGKVMRAIKKTTFDLTSAVTKELELEEKEKQPPADPKNKEELPGNQASKP
jgi:sec-independent protein translocase protein TatB